MNLILNMNLGDPWHVQFDGNKLVSTSYTIYYILWFYHEILDLIVWFINIYVLNTNLWFQHYLLNPSFGWFLLLHLYTKLDNHGNKKLDKIFICKTIIYIHVHISLTLLLNFMKSIKITFTNINETTVYHIFRLAVILVSYEILRCPFLTI